MRDGRQAIRWLLTPLIVLGLIVVLIRPSEETTSTLERILIGLTLDLAVIVVALGVLAFLGARMAREATAVIAGTPFGQAIAAKRYRSDEVVSELLRGGRPPMAVNIAADEIAVWVSGHAHGPSLADVVDHDGHRTVIANTGCWLRQLQPVEARLGLPTVFVPAFVQTHVRVRVDDGTLLVELWDHPRPVDRRLRWIDPFRIVPKGPKSIDRRLQWTERLAIVGRMPMNPAVSVGPRIVARQRL